LSKFSKRSTDLPPMQLKKARKKLASIVASLRAQNQSESELYRKAKHWIDVESKSHWDKMDSGEDVSELVKKIGTSAAEIVWEYNTMK
jgi:hypothetical protein